MNKFDSENTKKLHRIFKEAYDEDECEVDTKYPTVNSKWLLRLIVALFIASVCILGIGLWVIV